MIVQQVNLYQDSLKQKRLSVGFYLSAAAVFVFFIGFSITDIYFIHHLKDERYRLQQAFKQLAIEQEKVKSLASTMPKQEADPVLTNELEQWQKKIAQLKQTVVLFDNHDVSRSQGFSAYFQALANQPVSEVWLTMIHFDVQEQRIKLEGSSFKTDKIPYFLQQLQKEPAFQGRTFAQLQIEQSAQMSNLMNFKLSTHLESAKKDHVK